MKTVLRPTACKLFLVILSILGLNVKGEVRTISCDFNSNFCGWTNTGISLFTMTDQLDTLSPFNGSFVTTSSKITSEYFLSSIPLPATLPQNTSIAFWYSTRKGYEAVYLRALSASGSMTIWERRPVSQGVQDITWAYVEFPVVISHGETLQFAAAVKKDGGLVALDEFIYFGEGSTNARPGRRHPALSCEFGRGFCDWSNQESASAKFQLIGQLQNPGITRPHLYAANTSGILLTVARLLSPCINILANTKIIVLHGAGLSKYRTELLVVSRGNGALPSIVPSYNEPAGTDNLKAASNVRIGLEVILRPGQSVQLLSVYVANEAETLIDSDGCSDIESEPLLSEYPDAPTVSCSFDRNLCGWQLSPQDTKTQVTIAREVLDVDEQTFIRVPQSGEGALVIQGADPESSDGMSQVGPLLSPEIVQLRPTQLYFYYNDNGLVYHAFLSAEYTNGTRTVLWSLKQRLQNPPGEQIKKWLPVRLRLCLAGRFRLAFHVLFASTSQLGFWLDELTVENEVDSFTTNFDLNTLSGCPINNTPSSASVTCDSGALESEVTSFCGWRCSDPGSNVSCMTAYVSSAVSHSSEMALKIETTDTVLTNSKTGSLVSPAIFVEPESQLVLSYIILGPPVRFTLQARDPGRPAWEVVKIFSFTFSIPEWSAMNIPFPKRFQQRTLQFSLLIEFLAGKPNPTILPVFFAVKSIWYTTEPGYTMAEQTDILPFAETCNGSIHRNITCDFQGQTCDWQPTDFGINEWNVDSERAVLNGTLSRFDKSTRELHTKYHLPLSSRLRFSYLLLGSGYAFFSLVAETPRDNRFRLWKSPGGLVVGNDTEGILQWTVVEMDLCLKFPFKLIFQAAVIGGNATIMLDDVTIQDECVVLSRNVDCRLLNLLQPALATIPTETELQPPWNGQHDCDFENGHLCGWKNNDPMQIQWYTEWNSEAVKGSYVSRLSWNSQTLTLPAFSYLVSPRLHPTGSPTKTRRSRKIVLRFNLRLSDVDDAYVELYFARTGTLAAEAIWNSHSHVDELRTFWKFFEVDIPDLDAANINQLVFAVTVLDSHGFVLLDDINLLIATDATSQTSLESQGALVLLITLAVLSVFGLICLLQRVMRYRNKPALATIPTETKLQPPWNGQHDCDFENGHLCGWKNNDPMQIQWYTEWNSEAVKGSYVSRLSWNSQTLTLPAFSYLVSPRLHPTGSPTKTRRSRKIVLRFNLRLSDVDDAYVELYFARTGTLAAEAIWNSHSHVDELRTFWKFFEVDIPDLDAANINQLVFAVTVLDSHGFVLLDDINLLIATDATSQTSLESQGALVLLITLAVLSVFGLICLLQRVMRYRNKPALATIPTETKLQPPWNGQHDCDFENGHLCGWKNNDPMQIQWYTEWNSEAVKGSYVSRLSWNSQTLTLPAFSYLVSPRLHPTGSPTKTRRSRKIVLRFNLRLSDVDDAYVELYFARTGTLAAEAIWNSHSHVDELRTFWKFFEVDIPDLDAANINQLVFAVTVLDSHGFVLLDDINLLIATDATSQTSLESQGALVLLIALAVLSVFGLICLLQSVMRYRNKASKETHQPFVGILPLELVERFEQPFWSIKLEKQSIGEGHFGQVQLGWMGNRPVAVKRIRRKSNTDRERFLAEMAVYIKIEQHRNIVELLGITVRGEFTIIMEYCQLGSLHSYLQREASFPSCSAFLRDEQGCRPCNEEILQLIAFAHDVARGMVFLSNQHIVHGDIASRNVLLNQKKRAKIADFGRAKFEGDMVTLQDDVEGHITDRSETEILRTYE